ncbi:hypothetical protein [Desulfatirhabdium butyrativorans]|uniref:hypothetical protein n=1 Tax=Desulfatirhabdium butyrativorans TaxID=340467 RepID=UPI00054D7F5A|nr:hypothetical protein [Desulfatirhabdium butyrativorans]
MKTDQTSSCCGEHRSNGRKHEGMRQLFSTDRGGSDSLRFWWCIVVGVVVLFVSSSGWAQDGFTQSDRERLARLEAAFSVFSQQIDKRFEQIDKRFEQVDKRFEELRADMNARFEQITNMFYTMAAIFTSLFVAVFGFAWWDRRSVLYTAKKAARQEVEERTGAMQDTTLTVSRILEALRGFAEKSPDLKEMLRRTNLL